MNNIKKVYFLYLLAFTAVLNGCALISPEMQVRIENCSEETNARTPSQRLGNSAYWSCLDREEKKQKLQIERNQIRLQCKDYGFKEGTSDFSNCLMSVDSDRKTREQISNEASRTRSMIQFK